MSIESDILKKNVEMARKDLSKAVSLLLDAFFDLGLALGRPMTKHGMFVDPHGSGTYNVMFDFLRSKGMLAIKAVMEDVSNPDGTTSKVPKEFYVTASCPSDGGAS